jgi:hypothetical protein
VTGRERIPTPEAACEAPAQVIATLRAFIERAQWTFAKTMPTMPHEYVVRDQWCGKDPARHAEFTDIVALIRLHGYPRRFGNREFLYVDVDAHRYWSMGAPPDETTIINRALLNDPKEADDAQLTLPL